MFKPSKDETVLPPETGVDQDVRQGMDDVPPEVAQEQPFAREEAVLEAVKNEDDCENCIDGIVGNPALPGNRVCEVCNGTGKR